MLFIGVCDDEWQWFVLILVVNCKWNVNIDYIFIEWSVVLLCIIGCLYLNKFVVLDWVF